MPPRFSLLRCDNNKSNLVMCFRERAIAYSATTVFPAEVWAATKTLSWFSKCRIACFWNTSNSNGHCNYNRSSKKFSTNYSLTLQSWLSKAWSSPNSQSFKFKWPLQQHIKHYVQHISHSDTGKLMLLSNLPCFKNSKINVLLRYPKLYFYLTKIAK